MMYVYWFFDGDGDCIVDVQVFCVGGGDYFVVLIEQYGLVVDVVCEFGDDFCDVVVLGGECENMYC